MNGTGGMCVSCVHTAAGLKMAAGSLMLIRRNYIMYQTCANCTPVCNFETVVLPLVDKAGKESHERTRATVPSHVMMKVQGPISLTAKITR